MARKERTKKIKKISVRGWKEIPVTREFERRYIRKGTDDSIDVVPFFFDNRVTVINSGRIYGITTQAFSSDTKANAYAKKAMLHINKTVKEFGR